MFSIAAFIIIGGILIIIAFIWMINQGLKAKDNFDELRKNREKLQW